MKQQRVSERKHRIFWPVLFAMLLTAAVGVIVAVCCTFRTEETTVVLRVNGAPVAAAELLLSVETCRSDVISYYYNTYGIEQGSDFWNTEIDGKTPRRRLFETAIKSAVQIKAEQLMMQEQGIVSDISWETFEKELSAENARRSAAVRAGDIIYGPEQYTKRGYYEYLHNNRLLELKAALNGGSDYSDTAFLPAYEAFAATLTVETDWEVIDKLPIS